jgi:hypothetical protein
MNKLIGGGFADDGPGLATYADALLDENGELSLYVSNVPRAMTK